MHKNTYRHTGLALQITLRAFRAKGSNIDLSHHNKHCKIDSDLHSSQESLHLRAYHMKVNLQ